MKMTVPVRFLHCADLHLGSRFVGIADSDPELAERMMSASYDALDTIVETANREAVDFVVFAGDIFDTSSETPYARSRFVRAVEAINSPCYIAYGNHDFSRKWEDSIPLPKNAHVFGPDITTFCFPDDESPVAAIHGFSYVKRQTESKARDFAGLPGMLNVAVMHTELDGPAESPYAPCRLADLTGRGIDYWALGHIHKDSVISENPTVVYPGTTQGRNVKESGPKGVYLVSCSKEYGINTDFVKTSAIDWLDIPITIDPSTNLTFFVNKIRQSAEPGSIIRIIADGSGPLNTALRTDRADIVQLIEKETRCKVSDMIVRTRPVFDLEERSKAGDFTAAVIDYGTNLSSSLTREAIIDRICSTDASASIRPILESMTSDEIRQILDDSIAYVVEKMLEAEQ